MAVAVRDQLGWRGPGLLLAQLLLVLVGARAGTPDHAPRRDSERPWRTGLPLTVAVHDGQAKLRIPSRGVAAQTLVVVSSLSRLPGPFPICLKAGPASGAVVPEPTEATIPRRPTLPPFRPDAIRDSLRGQPATNRVFHMMVRDGDVTSPTNYVSVRGVLRAVGQRVAVYVAAEDLDQVEPAVLKDLVSTFDERIFPVALRSVGVADDIDGDGRFTVMLSSWLSRLGSGRHAVDGFVRVTDLDPTFTAPFGNHCDMMFLSTRLKPGPQLRTVLAHEYMHAVVFSAKAHSIVRAGGVAIEEEGWLDEALAHLAEDLHGFSRSNIDYRVSAFLSQPDRYQLAVEDYYAADLFRSHGNRGSTYLFLRWCADRYGPGLVPALVQSPRRGVANLEEATGCSFAELYRRWSVALYLSGLEPGSPDAADDNGDAYRSIDMRRPLDGWELAGPRATSLSLEDPAERWDAAGTSSHYVLVDVPAVGGVEVQVSGPETADLQVTAVHLPITLARLELSIRTTTGSDGDLLIRTQVRERGGQAVHLTGLGWEPLVPAADAHQSGLPRGRLDERGITSSFGTSALEARRVLDSEPIRLSGIHLESGPLVVKLVGTDAAGHRVAAWAQLRDKSGSNTSHDDRPLAEHRR
jgi:hypothetical protein